MPHFCIPCRHSFTSFKALDAHRRDSPKHNVCIVCDADFATDESLKQHYVDSTDHICCETCLRVFLTNEALIEHFKNSWKHNYCSLCDQHFRTAAALRQHSNYEHRFCARCDEGFNSVEDLQRHNREEHHACNACIKIFSTEQDKVRHAVERHPYCAHCERAFRTEHDFFQHFASKHELHEIACQGQNCGKAFKSYGALMQHFDSGYCPSGLTSDRLSKLVVDSYRNKAIVGFGRFIRTSTSNTVQAAPVERPWYGRIHDCPLCNKTFISHQQFCAHLRSPGHKTLLYRCPNGSESCGIRFGTFSALTQHLESGKCGLNRFIQVKELLGLLNHLVGKAVKV